MIRKWNNKNLRDLAQGIVKFAAISKNLQQTLSICRGFMKSGISNV